MSTLLRNKKFIISLLLLVLVILSAGIFLFLSTHRFVYNAPGTVGNTAGNLYNKGLFAQLEDKVYFANSFDGYALYEMHADETKIRKVSNAVAQNLLAAGDCVFFFQNGTNGKGGFANVAAGRGFNRYRISRDSIDNMTKDIVIYNQLVDNDLYMLSLKNNSLRFFKMKIDQTEETELGNSNINPACARDGVVYYAGADTDHALHSFAISDDTPHIVLQRNLWYPFLYGEWLYYLDLDTNYRLFRYHMSTGETEQLTTDRVDCYNIGGGYIYYQKNSSTSPQLICMQVDGSNPTLVAEGNYTNINMTSHYVYFQEFGQEYTTYHCPLGSASYSTFQVALEAALTD